jgi:hypothetical protein
MSIQFSDPIFLFLAVPTIALFVWTVLQQITISQIKKRQKILFEGAKGGDLEKILLQCKKRTTSVEGDIKDLYEITSKIQELSLKSLHKVGLVRFNPFRDIGGDQSFSVALLDDGDNGIVLSSLYSRDGVRVYAKSIQKGLCEKHQLTEEEKHAISIATSEKNNQKQKRAV